MKPNDRQKMCPNCNGRVPMDAAECPYCAAEFPESSKNSSIQTPLFKNQSLQESLASLYSPPYTNPKLDKEVPPRQAVFKEPASPIINNNTGVAAIEEEQKEESKGDFWTIFALIVGGNFLTLGLLQVFFSEQGALRLEWDSSFWYLYCLIALPLFYFGLKKPKEQQ
jgi:hypothetical protein